QAYWEALGLPADTLVFENGSGFSQRGRVTTTALVDLIAVASRVSGGQGLLSALPVAGEEGTLRARLRRSGKRVRAKTGTMAGISGLTGVITAEDGTPQVAFSILSNVRDGGAGAATRRKRAEDLIVTAVLKALDEWALERSTTGAGAAAGTAP
ncbi:MAG TPA: D-alanyl-D-alanine carboxypeptidase, partial [Nannocystis sp.]